MISSLKQRYKHFSHLTATNIGLRTILCNFQQKIRTGLDIRGNLRGWRFCWLTTFNEYWRFYVFHVNRSVKILICSQNMEHLKNSIEYEYLPLTSAYLFAKSKHLINIANLKILHARLSKAYNFWKLLVWWASWWSSHSWFFALWQI